MEYREIEKWRKRNPVKWASKLCWLIKESQGEASAQDGLLKAWGITAGSKRAKQSNADGLLQNAQQTVKSLILMLDCINTEDVILPTRDNSVDLAPIHQFFGALQNITMDSDWQECSQRFTAELSGSLQESERKLSGCDYSEGFLKMRSRFGCVSEMISESPTEKAVRLRLREIPNAMLLNEPENTGERVWGIRNNFIALVRLQFDDTTPLQELRKVDKMTYDRLGLEMKTAWDFLGLDIDLHESKCSDLFPGCGWFLPCDVLQPD